MLFERTPLYEDMNTTRSISRSAPQSSFINVAEARREVVSALNLHRSSSSYKSSSNNCNYGVSSRYYCYSVFETLPVPEPTWSTTPPTILEAPSMVTPPTPPEAVEFEWEESFAASYTWWLEFLKSLDGQSGGESKYPFDENVGKHSWVFGQRQNGQKLVESPCLDANDQSSYLDGLLMIPPTEEENLAGSIDSSPP